MGFFKKVKKVKTSTEELQLELELQNLRIEKLEVEVALLNSVIFPPDDEDGWFD